MATYEIQVVTSGGGEGTDKQRISRLETELTAFRTDVNKQLADIRARIAGQVEQAQPVSQEQAPTAMMPSSSSASESLKAFGKAEGGKAVMRVAGAAFQTVSQNVGLWTGSQSAQANFNNVNKVAQKAVSAGQTTLGLAQAGFLIGGPQGAIIGAAIGVATELALLGIELATGADRKARDLQKRLFESQRSAARLGLIYASKGRA